METKADASNTQQTQSLLKTSQGSDQTPVLTRTALIGVHVPDNSNDIALLVPCRVGEGRNFACGGRGRDGNGHNSVPTFCSQAVCSLPKQTGQAATF